MKIKSIQQAQRLVKEFSQRSKWEDVSNIDKFDHFHGALIEMSQHLRYKTKKQRIKFVHERKEIFQDGVGDLFFGLCRPANQLNVDIE